MFNRVLWKLQDHNRNVPLLRGKIHFLSVLFYPYVIKNIFRKDISTEVKYSLLIFITSHVFNLITSTLLHNNQLYKYRSAYKRIDIASIFILSPGMTIPAAVYYMKYDAILATVVFLQWVFNFMGVFWSLVSDFCCFQKEYRSFFLILINTPDLFLLYKSFCSKDYLGFLFLAFSMICFVSGAIVYCQERPPIIDGIFGHHEMFHLLLVIGFGLIVMGNKFIIK